MIRNLAARLFRHRWFRLARFVSRFAPPPTDRAHLLIAPEEGDGCDGFSLTYEHRDCETDGHYLCRLCSRRVQGDGMSERNEDAAQMLRERKGVLYDGSGEGGQGR